MHHSHLHHVLCDMWFHTERQLNSISSLLAICLQNKICFQYFNDSEILTSYLLQVRLKNLLILVISFSTNNPIWVIIIYSGTFYLKSDALCSFVGIKSHTPNLLPTTPSLLLARLKGFLSLDEIVAIRLIFTCIKDTFSFCKN